MSSRWVAAGLACSLLAYLLLAAPLLDVPLRADETIWPPAAAAIAEGGTPQQDFEDQALVAHPDSFVRGYERDYGVWHPPAYLYALALPTAALDDATAGRVTQLLFGLATVLVVFLAALGVSRRLGLGERIAGRAATAAALALATTPYWVAYSLFLDIDTSLYPLACFVVVWLAVRSDRMRRVGPLALLLTALHWVKLTAFGFTALGLVIHWALVRRGRLAGRAAFAATLATALFVITWIAYAQIADFPVTYMTDYFQADKGGGQSVRSLFEVLNTLRGFVAGVGFPVALLVVIGGVRYTLRMVRGTVEDHDAFFVVGMLTVLTYTLLFPYAGKYVVPALPLLVLHGTVEAVRVVVERRLFVDRRRLALVIGAVLAVFAYQLLAVGDMITGPEFRDAAARNFGAALDDPRLVRYVLALVPLAALAVAARLLLRVDAAAALAVAALVAVVPANAAETIATEPNQQSSVLPLRERGFEQVVDRLEQAPPATLVIADADVAFHVPALRVVPEDRPYYYPSTQLTETLADPRVRYVVVARGREPTDAGFAEALASDFILAKRAGTFSIYERR